MNTGTQPQTEQPAYVAAFGLDVDPFRDRLEDRFFYADPVLMQRLDLLQHLTQFSDQLLYVRGPEGAGKTTLLRQLKLRAADHWRICHLDGSRLSSPAELYVELSRCFPDAPAENTETFGSDLIHYCLGLQQSGQLAVVVIDAAEQLPPLVLEALLGLGASPTDTVRALRVLLFGAPELYPALQSLGLTSPTNPLLHTLDLPAFDEQQSAAYLMYRLAIAGYSGDSPFSATEVKGMHKAAGGLPGELNRLARTTLIEQGQRLATRRHRAPVAKSAAAQNPPARGTGLKWFALLASLLAVVIAGGFGWLWYMGSPSPSISAQDEQTVALPPPRPLQIPRTQETPSPAPAEEALDPGATPPLLARNRPEAEDRESPAAEAAATATPPDARTTPAPPTPSAGDAAPAASEAPAASQPEPPAPATAGTGPETPAPEPAAPEQPTPAEPPVQVESPEPVPAEPEAAPARSWLERQPADHYTLQLLGARSSETVAQFLDAYDERVELHSILTELKDADWHIVVTGSYPDRKTAVRKINDLPAPLRQLKPWPRRFSQIRAAQGEAP